MDEVNFSHKSVLLYECIEALNIRDGYTYVDCTTGGGGHSLEIAKRMGKNSRLICFDQDSDAIKAAKERLADFSSRVTFINENFSSLGSVLEELKVDNLGGVIVYPVLGHDGLVRHLQVRPHRGIMVQFTLGDRTGDVDESGNEAVVHVGHV